MDEYYPKFKAASVQIAPVFLDREATTQKVCDNIKDAGSKGAELVVFSETIIPGYPFWWLFLPAEDGLKQYYRKLYKNSVEVPSDTTDKLCQAAREAEAYTVVGISERIRGKMGALYNSQLFIDNKGKIMGVHRKLVPTLYERLVYMYGDGSTLKVFQTDLGELGGLICGEHTNSLAKFAMFAQGEKIHTASWTAFCFDTAQIRREGALVRNRSHAYEGKVFAVCSTGWFSDEMKEELCDTEEKERKIVSGGGFSSIIGPLGEFLAGPNDSGEGIIYAELDTERLIDVRGLCDITGHYNRFDVLSLWLNDKPNPVIRYAEPVREMPLDQLDSRLQSYLQSEKLPPTIPEEPEITKSDEKDELHLQIVRKEK